MASSYLDDLCLLLEDSSLLAVQEETKLIDTSEVQSFNFFNESPLSTDSPHSWVAEMSAELHSLPALQVEDDGSSSSIFPTPPSTIIAGTDDSLRVPQSDCLPEKHKDKAFPLPVDNVPHKGLSSTINSLGYPKELPSLPRGSLRQQAQQQMEPIVYPASLYSMGAERKFPSRFPVVSPNYTKPLLESDLELGLQVPKNLADHQTSDPPNISFAESFAAAKLKSRLPTSATHKAASLASTLQPIATTLAARTTEQFIADLKRPSNASHSINPKRRHGSLASAVSNNLNTGQIRLGEKSDGDVNPENVENEGEFEDDDDTDLPVAKPRKISERKRRMHAVADSYFQQALRDSFKKENKAAIEDQERQSTRWLVNESESHRIITTPREYQTELFERAKEKNIIAVLDTGSGKTLIAVLLLRHTFAEELENRALGKPKRISFFLVDSVALVFQQHAVLKANLDQPMDMFCGDMGVDLWNQKIWEKHFNDNMVIVCTAEVLRQCLHHSFISIDQINLLIFDEAHHAKKDHAYARIIKDFYASKDIDKSLRPRIFGMTASPVDTRVDVRKAAAQLEGLLHCEIATAKDGLLDPYKITSQQELLAKYSALGPKVETPLYKEMYDIFKTNPIFNKPLLYSHNASRELGTWCSDQIWSFCLGEEESKKLLAKTERAYHAKRVSGPLEILEKDKSQLRKAQELVKSWTFDHPHFDGSSSSRNLSSKVVLLIQYLRERFERKTDDKAIVFVRQRYTARLLADLFSHSNIRTPHIRVGILVGTRSGDAGDMNVSYREQVLTMMKFRKGTINCLFATSVAEEGLDIPDCNLVIRFDLYTTLIQYIQSRGRARHANSRFIHMCEDRNQDHAQIIREVRRNEAILKTFCQSLPTDRLLTGNDFDLDYCLKKEKSQRFWRTPANALLDYRTSLMVLANFVSSLPNATESSLHPEYIMSCLNKQFTCEVVLPEASPIRGAIGLPCSTKQVAKCSSAFETCLLLANGKYLDDNLIPIFTKQLPAMRNAILAVDSKKREAYDMRLKPDMWSEGGVPEQLFLTVLSLESPETLGRSSQPLGLLTRSKIPDLPSFMLHFGPGKNSPVQLTSFNQPLQVDAGVLNLVNKFTLCIFNDVFSKEYESDESKMPYFLVPIKSHGLANQTTDASELISWDIIKNVFDHELKWGDHPWDNKTWQDAPDEFFEDKFIVDPWDGSRKLWTVGVDPRFKALDPVPPNSAPRVGPRGTRKVADNIMEYSSSLWAKARAKRTFDENQRVVEARFISLRRNLLDQFDAPDGETPNQCWVILEPLKISSLPSKVVAMAYLFPAIIHRVESYLIALDACALLHLDIRPDLALEAVTKDSDNSGEHGDEQINFQRGMGNNYERLEFLGDSFLKMACSISLYGLHPDNDEYSYHVDRMMLICNKNLKNNAIKLKLYEYIRSQEFNRRAWYPEGLVLKKGKTAKAPNSHKLGDKSIADVCEALIGAALLTCHESKDMDNAVRAVTELVSSDNHRVTSWSDYYKLYKKPKYQTAIPTAAQRDLARQIEEKHSYHFKYPRLLRSAFVHPSYPFSYERIPSYQRLEFLGDALLDMACINFLFHEFPTRNPQWLTEHKMAMVSNQFLGALCVALGFHRHLLLFNAAFQKQIEDYVTDITEARIQAEEDALRAGKTREEYSPDYWTSVRQPPKCLPDIVEAYVGAIFVDSEYNYNEVERFFDEHIKWYFSDMSIYDTFANKHPTTFLTKFLQINMGCSHFDLPAKEIPTIDGSKPSVMVVVVVHAQVVASYQAESSRYAKVGAAKKALEVLTGLPLAEFREKYGCDCNLEVESLEGEEDNDQGAELTAI